jgi:hypothetical protein
MRYSARNPADRPDDESSVPEATAPQGDSPTDGSGEPLPSPESAVTPGSARVSERS